MPDSDLSIVWFRQDLRLADNPALLAAASSARVLPIYIFDETHSTDWSMGAASRVWLHHSLKSLNQSLDGKLHFFSGDAREIMSRLVDQLKPTSVVWNRCYQPWGVERDKQIKQQIKQAGAKARSFSASLLWEPWTIQKGDGTPYRVFTAFYRKGCLPKPTPRAPLAQPEKFEWASDDAVNNAIDSQSLESLKLLPSKNWPGTMIEHWQVGEQAAIAKLESFITTDLSSYNHGRDFPASEATSKLSPHLVFGEISPHQIWQRVEQESFNAQGPDLECFRSEVGWREFAYHLLFQYPQLPDANFNRKFDQFPWRDDAIGLQAWQRGQTGYPIVDAGMRELWQTGYMHNRVRMIVASFLIKNMGLHWRHGAQWFWDCLVDADLANNSAGWQWCAGSGADAAPYFRVFNPLLQSQKFDPDGEYLTRYCPELAGLPVKYRHQPWLADDSTLSAAGLRLGVDYPRPILDLKFTRERALGYFKQLRPPEEKVKTTS